MKLLRKLADAWNKESFFERNFPQTKPFDAEKYLETKHAQLDRDMPMYAAIMGQAFADDFREKMVSEDREQFGVVSVIDSKDTHEAK